METKFKVSAVEQFVTNFVKTHRKGPQLSQRLINVAVAMIDKKLLNDRAPLTLQPGQYCHLTLGVQMHLNSVRMTDQPTRNSVAKAKAILQAF